MLLRRYHPLVWAVTGLHVLAAVAFALLVPMFRAPDEAQHVDLIRQFRVELGFEPPNRMIPQGADVSIANRSVADPEVLPRPPLLLRDAVPRPDRPSFADLAAPGQAGPDENHLTHHPPTYYAAVAGATSFLAGLTPSGLWSWDREVLMYRLGSILLTAPLPLLAAEAAAALALSRRAGAAAAAIILLSPQATSVAAAVNNDALVMLGASIAVVASMHHLRTGRHRSAWLATAAAAVAALTKATAAPVLAWVVLVVVVAAWGRWRDPEARSSLVGTGVGAAVGATWYVRNLLLFGDAQPSGFRAPKAEGIQADMVGFVPAWASRLSQSFWGLPARRTGVGLPAPVSHGLSAGVLGLSVLALRDARRRPASVLLILLVVSQVLLLAQTNLRAHLRTGVYPAVQGRYLFALLIPLALLCVVGARQLRTWWPGRVPMPSTTLVALSVASVGAVLHLLLAASMLQGFWGDDAAGLGDRLAAVVAWSPLPALMTHVVVWALVAATAVLVVGTLSRAVQELRASRHDGPGQPSPPVAAATADR